MSPVVKRSITIRGHRTSISIEGPFWRRLQAIGVERAVPLARLVAEIDASRPPGANLSSAIRLFVLEEALSQRSSQRSSQPPSAACEPPPGHTETP